MGAETSVLAFKRAKGRMAQQRATVLQHIINSGDRGMTVSECAKAMGVTPNMISGRFTELGADGKLLFVEKRKIETGNLAKAWKIKPTPQPKDQHGHLRIQEISHDRKAA
jgi:predicted ArsR family transcriptional regulator